MAFQDFSQLMVISCMTDPLKKILRESEILTSPQLKETAATLDAATQIFASSDLFSITDEKSRKEKDDIILSTIKDVCFPLFYSLQKLPDTNKSNSERRTLLYSLLQCLTEGLGHLNDQSLVCAVVMQTMVPLTQVSNQTHHCIMSMKDSDFHRNQGEKLEVISLIELFQVSFNKPSAMEVAYSSLNQCGTSKDELHLTLFQILVSISEVLAHFSKAMQAIIKLLSLCSKNRQGEILEDIWSRFTKPLPINVVGSFDKDALWQSLFVYYCFKDWFFPLEKSVESEHLLASHLQDGFWLIVQAGLLSSEPSHRKMSMYLLKRLVDTCQQNDCVVNTAIKVTGNGDSEKQTDYEKAQAIFWWHPKSSSKLSSIWEDYIILMEVLEEKQVHVIKPLLPRVKSLVSACSTQSKGTKNELPLMHSSWLMTMFARSFHHESHYLSRWGAVTLLTTNMSEVPFARQGQLKFLSNDLISYLQENRLYSRYEGLQSGKNSPVREALVNFFRNLFESLNQEDKVKYLNDVLQKVCDNTWGSIPLVFLFQSLSLIPSQPIMTSGILELIRYIIQACLTTHEVATRGAIECFICQMMMNLVDVEEVTPTQFFRTMAEFHRQESFQRGTHLWATTVEWLGNDRLQQQWTEQMVVTDAMAYLKQDHWKDSEASIVFEGSEVVGVARMLLLFADATVSQNDSKDLKLCSLGSVLSEMSGLLSNIGSRAYVNTKHVDASLALLNCLVKEVADGISNKPKEDKTKDLIKTHVTCNLESIVAFIISRLSQDLTKAEDLDEIKFYADVISTTGSLCDKVQKPVHELIKFIGNVFRAASKSNEDSEVDLEVLTLSAVTVYNSVLKIVLAVENTEMQVALWNKIMEIPSVHEIPRPFTKRSSGSMVSNLQIGRVISHFVSNRWQCRKSIFEMDIKTGQIYSRFDLLVDEAMDALSIGSGDSDIAVIQTMELVMDQILQFSTGSQITQLFKAVWNKLLEEKKNALFWQRIESIIPTVLHPAVLKQDKNSEVASYVEEFLTDVLELAEAKAGLTYLLMQRLTSVMAEHDNDKAIARWLVDKLIDASIFGNIYQKGKRLLLDIFAYLENMGDQLATNQITSSISKNDMNTRVLLINWLMSLKHSSAYDREFASVFLRCLKEKYLHLANISSYKQFSNSHQHRLKHRMLLIFLPLSEFVKQDECQEYLDDLWQALILECHPSVRHNLEWVVMRLILRYPAFVSSIWDTFSKFTENRSMCICSLFLVMSRIGPKLPKEMQNGFYCNAISQTLSWCVAHHYNTRIFAQACLMRLWEQCQQLGLTQVTEKLHVVQCTVDFITKNGNSSGTVPKLMENFMFSAFDPIQDFSAETIFYTLPRLASITDEEWILPEQLLKHDPSWNTAGNKLVPLHNASCGLAQCEEGPWRMKAQVVNEDQIVESTDGDFQKKIVSWRQMSPDQETETEQITQRRRLKDGGLVLVTSLIDKVPNLGGLCRTSEIFGVSEFVIGNLTHLEDRMFQSLSVSAHKWLNITEVAKFQINKYLDEKKAQGYILVGVEQTANSVSLDKYVFPKKTLLLLGNEKEGIPPDMIQNLDVCVEIPQQGIIRSLNVHVCGALIVWEYTRQNLTSDSS